MNYYPVGKSGKIKVDGEEVSLKKLDFIPMLTGIGYRLDDYLTMSAPPAASVVYKNEIHLLGGGNTTKRHFGIDVKTGEYKSYANLPFEFDIGSAVVLNDEIHLLGSNHEPTKHYKWDGETWTEVSTIPFNVYYSVAVVLNGEIHLIGGANNSNVHYKWDGGTWTQVGTAPWGYVGDKAAVVINGEIHLLASYGNDGYHYKWNGETWTNVGSLPTTVNYKYAVSSGNAIYLYNNAETFYMWTEDINIWHTHKTGVSVMSGSPCNVYFGGWHIFYVNGSKLSHNVCAVPLYVPIFN